MAQKTVIGAKKTRQAVLIADKIADKVITIGGILVIAAVMGMMIFLVSEALPLFKGGEVLDHSAYRLKDSREGVVALAIDDFKTIAAAVGRDGNVTVWHPRTGTPLKSASFDLKGKQITAVSQTLDNHEVAFGFSDGTVRFAGLSVKTDVLSADQAPSGLSDIDKRDRTDGTAVFSLIAGKQVRKTWVELTLEDGIQVSAAGKPIAAMDYRTGHFGEKPFKTLAAVDADGAGFLIMAESKLNLFTRKLQTRVNKTALPPLPQGASIVRALVTERGDGVYFAERSGRIYRYNASDFSKPFLAETVQVTPRGVQLTVLGFLLGEGSMVVGGSDGSVNIYFLLRGKDAVAEDGFSLIRTRNFEPQPGPIVQFCPSRTGRSFATLDASGGIWIREGTSEKTLLRMKESLDQGTADGKMLLTPRRDGLLAVLDDGRTNFWDLDIPHPESSLKTLFGKVWYEGYPEPTYTWQSTGGTDAFEPKLSLVPLIFGTLKAAFYSLLFAIPIAMLGAIYTSEFLHPSVRGKIKPAIEVMASIPSVVLGFVAALVLAPLVEMWIAAVLLAFAVLPASLILAAYLWQLLPLSWNLRLQGISKLLFMSVVVIGALWAAYRFGPAFERLFFQGDFKAWLHGAGGSAAPFWFLLFLPLSALGATASWSRLAGPHFNAYMRNLSPIRAGLLDLGRWFGIVAVTVGLSYAIALFLQALGLDARGSIVDTYVQRNTLVVGFAMGFAVIPIIYTLAEDALNAVPEHLRAASLSCGATPWQTALWIILPTAISGVFSAVMIGMGRAVGETMIVVMSAGNTPLIDINIFDGLRALSANIAVELPEAPKDDTLYRVLFLTGLVLFAMTFVINTFAEMVRLRFRKRSMQL